jgi:CRISPR/Cas system-associated protein Cas5 (RAMP superfamily)
MRGDEDFMNELTNLLLVSYATLVSIICKVGFDVWKDRQKGSIQDQLGQLSEIRKEVERLRAELAEHREAEADIEEILTGIHSQGGTLLQILDVDRGSAELLRQFTINAIKKLEKNG